MPAKKPPRSPEPVSPAADFSHLSVARARAGLNMCVRALAGGYGGRHASQTCIGVMRKRGHAGGGCAAVARARCAATRGARAHRVCACGVEDLAGGTTPPAAHARARSRGMGIPYLELPAATPGSARPALGRVSLTPHCPPDIAFAATMPDVFQ